MAIQRRSSERVQRILKAAVAAGSTTTLSALTELRPVSDAFLGLLRGHSVFDDIAASAIRLPTRTRVVIASGGGTAAVTGEGGVAPVMQLSVSAPPLEELKAQGIVVVSTELVRTGGAPLENLVNRELRNVIARVTNQHFITAITPTGSPPPDVASEGVDANGVLEDITTLLAALNTDPFSRIHLAMGAGLAKILSTMPTIAGEKAFPGMSIFVPSDIRPGPRALRSELDQGLSLGVYRG